MRTVTFDELEPGMLLSPGDSDIASDLFLPVLVIEKNPKDKTFGGKPTIKVILGYADPWTMLATDIVLNVLHERGTKEHQERINEILSRRLKRIEDIKKDCEILRGFLNAHYS